MPEASIARSVDPRCTPGAANSTSPTGSRSRRGRDRCDRAIDFGRSICGLNLNAGLREQGAQSAHDHHGITSFIELDVDGPEGADCDHAGNKGLHEDSMRGNRDWFHAIVSLNVSGRTDGPEEDPESRRCFTAVKHRLSKGLVGGERFELPTPRTASVGGLFRCVLTVKRPYRWGSSVGPLDTCQAGIAQSGIKSRSLHTTWSPQWGISRNSIRGGATDLGGVASAGGSQGPRVRPLCFQAHRALHPGRPPYRQSRWRHLRRGADTNHWPGLHRHRHRHLPWSKSTTGRARSTMFSMLSAVSAGPASLGITVGGMVGDDGLEPPTSSV